MPDVRIGAWRSRRIARAKSAAKLRGNGRASFSGAKKGGP